MRSRVSRINGANTPIPANIFQPASSFVRRNRLELLAYFGACPGGNDNCAREQSEDRTPAPTGGRGEGVRLRGGVDLRTVQQTLCFSM
jgi:hypothetical protein